jgi:hypothetical protein
LHAVVQVRMLLLLVRLLALCLCKPTFFVLRFIRMSSFSCSVMGLYSCIQAFFSGVMRCWGTVTCMGAWDTV